MLKLIVSILTTIWLSSSVVSAGAHSQYLDYTVGNKQFRAFAVFPKTESKGNVYIIHDWNGLTDYEQKRAGMLADLGFTAIALDLFGVDASYAQKLVTVRLGGVLKLLDPVFELNPLNDFWQSICAAELSPFLLC